MKTTPLVRALALILTLTSTALHAQVPQLINYQGRVAVGTVNFDGTGSFKFALVNTGATETYWTNDGTNIGTPGGVPTAAVSLAVTKGLYSVGLGDTALANMTAVPVAVFDQADVRLRVWFDDGVNGSQLLSPDQPLSSVGFAMKAASADSADTVPAGAITGAMLADDAVGGSKIDAGAVGNTQLASGLTLGGTTTGTFSGPLNGNATSATTATTAGSATNFTGPLAGNVTGTQGATVVENVGGVTAANVAGGANLANAATNLNTADTLVKRDPSGNFAAGTITGALNGNAATATTATSATTADSATNFTGPLAGNVTGTQGATVVENVGGVTAANVASGANLANAATNLNTADTLVKRDASGNFTAGTITGALNGNAATATSAGSALTFTGNLAGDVTGTQGATAISNGAVTTAKLANNLTLGGTTTGTFSGPLDGNATTATSATNFTGSLAGDVTGTQGATAIAAGAIVNADVNAAAAINATKLGTGIVSNTEFNYLNNVTSSIQTQFNGKMAKAGDTMTGMLTLPAGTTTLAPLKLQAGVNRTTPLFGAVEFDGTDVFVTNNSGSPTRKTLAFTDSTITAGQIANGSITSAMLANGAVTSSAIASGAVTGSKIAPMFYGGTQYDPDVVDLSTLLSGTVTAAVNFDRAFGEAPDVSLPNGWTLSGTTESGFTATSAFAPVTVDSADWVGYSTSLAVVAGRPAISYSDVTNGDLKYAIAPNADGTGTWTTLTVDSAGNVGVSTSLAVVDGRPAISYYDNTNANLKYAIAPNADGTGTWTTLTVDSAAGTVGTYTSLAVVDGRPAISYHDDTNDDLKYAIAPNAAGTGTWTTLTVDSAGNVGSDTSLAVVDGRPAISYYDDANDDLKYAIAPTADGSGTWTTLTVDSAGSVGTYTSLAVVDGRPAISYYDLTNGDLKYALAPNAAGTGTWTTLTVDSAGNFGTYTSLAVVDGRPAISYYDSVNHSLKYALAPNAAGTGTWTTLTVDSAGSVGTYTSLAVVGGRPAISYFDDTNDDLKYAALPSLTGWTARDPGNNGVIDAFSAGVADGGVTSAAIANGAVTSTQIAVGTVLPTQTVAGTLQTVVPSTSYTATGADLTRFELPVTANVGDVVKVSGAGAGGWAASIYDPTSWTPRESEREWTSVASSADGTKLVAAVSLGQIYTSTDSGVNWTARESSQIWRSVASSADGSKLVAGGSDYLYTSIDSGVNWTAQTSAGARFWRSVATSADGSKIVATDYGGYIYTSTYPFSAWVQRETIRNWWSVASSADGSKLVAVVNPGYIYTSADAGVSWTPRMTDSNRGWGCVASSADGSKLVAGVNPGQIYTSTDFGVSWTARESHRSWYSVASSADGSRLVAVEVGGKIYTSTDSGVSWTAQESDREWESVASSADGSMLVAVDNGDSSSGRIYTSGTAVASGVQGTAATLQYLGNGQWMSTEIWQVNGADVYRSSGKVGIGTTNPGAPLDIQNAIKFQTDLSEVNNWASRLFMAEDLSNNYGFSMIFNGRNSSSPVFDGTTVGAVPLNYFGIARHNGPGSVEAALVISRATGNIGIGTESPSRPLTIQTGSQDYGLRHTNGTVNLDTYLATDSGQLGTHSNHAIKLFTNNSTRMTILPDGKVGIGTATPAYQLQLGTDSAAKPNGGSWANSSDRRLKRNITTMPNALEKLQRLRGVNFEWVNPEDHASQTGTQGGFIAQEVEAAFPGWVTDVDAAEHDKALTDNGKIKSMSLPFEFDALVVNAIKEQQVQIEDRDAEIAVLKGRLAELEAKDKTRDEKLASIERLLLEREPSAVRTVAIDQEIQTVTAP